MEFNREICAQTINHYKSYESVMVSFELSLLLVELMRSIETNNFCVSGAKTTVVVLLFWTQKIPLENSICEKISDILDRPTWPLHF